jgi:phosphoribosyl-ATP pyrophosphohydrolase/phosphoribosyl-AMP cyclohydrolase
MLKFDEKGLIPVVIQDADSGEVLTLAYMSEESLRRTLESGQVWFWSRSRQELWHKGATSGNFLDLVAILQDCDGDALVKVHPAAPPTPASAPVFQALEEAPQRPERADRLPVRD